MRNKPCRPFSGGSGARPGLWVPGDGLERVARPYWPPWCCCRPPRGGRGGCPFWAPGVGAGMAHPRRWALWGVPWPVGRFSGPVGGPPAALAAFLFFGRLAELSNLAVRVRTATSMSTAAPCMPAPASQRGSWLQSTPWACRGQPPQHWRPSWRSAELGVRRTCEPAARDQQLQPSSETCDRVATSRRCSSKRRATTGHLRVPIIFGRFAMCSH